MGILCGRWPWSAERWEAEKARRGDGRGYKSCLNHTLLHVLIVWVSKRWFSN